MKLIALTGRAGAGKDTFADRLVAEHGFVKRGFADPLYEEVAKAYGLMIRMLRDREGKELPHKGLAFRWCSDASFVNLMLALGFKDMDAPRSPRWVLQHWGTEFRRGQNDRYWIDQMAAFVGERSAVVIPDCRFLNEGRWVCQVRGTIVRIERPSALPVNKHVTEIPLPDEMVERTVHNVGSISYLKSVADSVVRGAERIIKFHA